MNLKRAMIVGYLGFLMLTSPSCVVLSNPISDPYQAEPDMKLFGSWQAIEAGRWADQLIVGKYSSVSEISAPLPPNLLLVEPVKLEKQDTPVEASNFKLLCFPTRIADTRYLNAAIVSRENEQTLLQSGWDEKLLFYAVFKYRVEGDKLTLQVLDLRGKPEAGWLSKVPGFVEGLGRFVTLADSQNLVEVLASKKGDKYFRDAGVFTRIKELEQPLAVAEPDRAL